jgi:ferredoxin
VAKRVVIDEQDCDGCQTCVELCPDVFEFDEDAEVARVINPKAEDACIEEAIDSCPSECISWIEE